jgi:hypothetical protein
MVSRASLIASTSGSAEAAHVQMGGITLWAEDAKTLAAGVLEFQRAISQVAQSHLSTTRAVLKKLVREALGGERLEDRVFSAVLGSVLRSGDIDTVICASKYDKGYRVYVHQAQQQAWASACSKALDLCRERGIISVRELETAIFGERRYNTWSSASHVLAYLTYRGPIQPAEDDSFCLAAFAPSA